jgi:uncharacterized protein YuzE
MKFTYDPRYNIAYIRLAERRSGIESLRLSDELIVDIAPDGTLYGIELLNANEQLRRKDEEGAVAGRPRLLVINEATNEQTEILLKIE